MTMMQMVLGMAVILSVPAYFAIQPMSLSQWGGGWRKAALMPLLLTVPAALYSLYALSHGSNLWPITLIFTAAIGSLYLASLYLASLWLVRRVLTW